MGIWLFRFQTEANDDRERDRLQTMLAIETQLNSEVLGERPAGILHARTGETIAQTRLVQLPLSALEELARSGFENPEVTRELMWEAAHIRVHNNDVSSLLGARGGTVTRASILAMAADLDRRQQFLKTAFEGLLQSLKEAGVEPPPLTDQEGEPRVDPFVSAEEARS